MQHPRVFVSTGGFALPPTEAVNALTTTGVAAIELSGGVHEVGVEERLVGNSSCRFQLHNYFPPASVPFVFNLSDPNPTARERSIRFACNAIELAERLGSSIYSFHAGFLGTPSVGDLGRGWGRVEKVSVDEGMELFCDSVERVNYFAREKGVKLLIENNVLTRTTAEKNGDDVLLMTSPDSIRAAFSQLPGEVGLLMDVAHFAVSAHTLGFEPAASLEGLSDLIGGYHLSENDYLNDLNDPVREDSWFWDYLDMSVPFATLEIDPGKVVDLMDQVLLVERKFVSRV